MASCRVRRGYYVGKRNGRPENFFPFATDFSSRESGPRRAEPTLPLPHRRASPDPQPTLPPPRPTLAKRVLIPQIVIFWEKRTKRYTSNTKTLENSRKCRNIRGGAKRNIINRKVREKA